MQKKKIPKRNFKKKQKVLFRYMTVFIAILLFFFCFYIAKLFSSQYRIKSRTKEVLNSQKKNSDGVKTVGWIRVQGTNIDYPVIYAPGYDFSDITDDFAWTEADYDGLNNIVFISGHNIKNVSTNPIIGDKDHSRFEQLMAYTYYDFVKKNQFIQYTIDGNNYLYKVYSVSYEDVYKLDLYNLAPYDDERMSKYLDTTKMMSIFNFDTDVRKTDKIISLDTCTRMYGSPSTMHFRVNGRLLRKGEIAIPSKVTTNTKYEEIEKLMKGEN